MNAPRQAGYPIAVEEMIELAAEADRSDHYTVERGDGLLLYASSHLSMARAVFAVWKERQPRPLLAAPRCRGAGALAAGPGLAFGTRCDGYNGGTGDDRRPD
jgi:hypothetical protein